MERSITETRQKFLGPNARLHFGLCIYLLLIPLILVIRGASLWTMPIAITFVTWALLSRSQGYFESRAAQKDHQAVLKRLAEVLDTPPQAEAVIARLRLLSLEVELSGQTDHPLLSSGPLAELFAQKLQEQTMSNSGSEIVEATNELSQAFGLPADYELPQATIAALNAHGREVDPPYAFRQTINDITDSAVTKHFIGFASIQVTYWSYTSFNAEAHHEIGLEREFEARELIQYLRNPPPIQF